MPTSSQDAASSGALAVIEETPDHERRQTVLASLGRRAMSGSGVLALMQDAAQLLAEAFDADFSTAAELVRERDALSMRLQPADGSSPVEFDVSTNPAESLAGFCLSVGQLVAITDLKNDDRVNDDQLLQAGARGALVCPLVLRDRAFGALGIYTHQPRQFAAADVLFAETITHLVTASVGREDSERQLAAEREFAATLLATVEAMVLVMNLGGYLLQLNRAAEQITGFTGEELQGRPIFTLTLPGEIAVMQGVLEKLRSGQSPVTFESAILTKQGQRRTIAWNFSLQANAQGAPAAIVGTGLDISEKCAAEALLAEAQAAVQRSEAGHLVEILPLPADTENARNRPGGFRKLKLPPNSDRRAKSRQPYPYMQSIAAMRGNRLPPRTAFQEVLCHDISASGFSFFAPRPPETEHVVVAFGVGGSLTHLQARVLHCTRVPDGSQFLIGCNYVGRLEG